MSSPSNPLKRHLMLLQPDRKIVQRGPSDTELSIQASEDRVAQPTFLQKMLMPVRDRKLANEMAEIRDEAVKELAIAKIEAGASLKRTQIQLDADKAKAKLRDTVTLLVGEQTRAASIKMVSSMKDNLVAETQWQDQVAKSNCSDEDKEFLSELAKSLAQHRIESVARQHNVYVKNESE